jgi:hypothetical protein
VAPIKSDFAADVGLSELASNLHWRFSVGDIAGALDIFKRHIERQLGIATDGLAAQEQQEQGAGPYPQTIDVPQAQVLVDTVLTFTAVRSRCMHGTLVLSNVPHVNCQPAMFSCHHIVDSI